MVDVLYMLPNTPEPRNVNIINLIKDELNTEVIFWQKNKEIPGNNLDPKVAVQPIRIKANDHNPLARIIPTFRYYLKANSAVAEAEPRCIHVSKLDSMFLIYLYCKRQKKKPYVIYDISDMHRLTYNDSKNPALKVIRSFLHYMEKKVSRCVDKIVVTSESFWEKYYKEFYTKEQMIFIPNAPDMEVFKTYTPKTCGKFTVGFIGSVRYYEQLKCLVDVAVKTDINVLIAGNGEDEEKIRKYSSGKENVKVTGRFNYTNEIAGLYSSVDCIFAQYDTSIKNINLALPNRLYESAACGLPLIVSKGTYLESVVKKYGLGISVQDLDAEELAEAIEWVKDQQKEVFIENGRKFTLDNDYSVRSQKLKNIYLNI